VGDPGAEMHFQGVALTRGNDTVTPEDEATAIHLVNEIKKLATMSRSSSCACGSRMGRAAVAGSASEEIMGLGGCGCQEGAVVIYYMYMYMYRPVHYVQLYR